MLNNIEETLCITPEFPLSLSRSLRLFLQLPLVNQEKFDVQRSDCAEPTKSYNLQESIKKFDITINILTSYKCKISHTRCNELKDENISKKFNVLDFDK